MSSSRILIAASLLLACAVVPTNRAHSQSPKSGQDIPPPRVVVNPKDVEDLKTALAELKTKATEDSKAAAAKIEEALKAAKEAKDGLKASEKSAADALAKAEAAEKVATEAKAGSGDAKATGEKITALEKGAEEGKKAVETASADAKAAMTTGKERGDTTWLMVSSALVLFMVPGLALFYGGMVRRKNVLATMMQSMAALAVVGVYWLGFGYALAFGPSVITFSALGVENGGFVGWSWDLVFLKGIEASTKLPAYDIPVYVHVMFQGMFAIITPALISGAIAERIRFWPFCIFMILWVTFVYCPLAHMVWAWDWFDTTIPAAKQGGAAIGFLGKMGALDFAGGTVVHIAAGMAGLACCLVLGKRHGYPKMVAHPNSMVLTLLGAGFLWFGWFGFNGGSATNSSALAGSAFAATQAAAAAAGLAWMIVEWIHKGKPTALGLASGIVAGLVAVTPASGFVFIGGGVCIGVAAAVICYIAVSLKNALGYDDSLDAFGVHGVGGFVGAVLTGVFCSALVQSASVDGLLAFSEHRAKYDKIKPVMKDGKPADSPALEELKKKAEEAKKKAEDKEKELTPKIEELAKAETAAQEAFDAGEVGKRDALADTLTEAKDKVKKEKEPLIKLQDEAGVAEGAVTTMLADITTLKPIIDKQDAEKKSPMSQLTIQIKAAVFSVVFAFVVSLVLCVLTQAITLGNFKTNDRGEAEGLDRTEHGEVGFDFSGATESVAAVSTEPRAASVPKGNGRFDLQVNGTESTELMKVWTDLCQPSDDPVDPNFLAVYPYVTTVRGTTFRCRGGDQVEVAKRLSALLTKHLGKEVKAVKV
ncbi:MAG: ammonium transporter [Planctomycetaceae bacterium]|nr:ammonium transporter [Planctomycetaceae bacterium]